MKIPLGGMLLPVSVRDFDAPLLASGRGVLRVNAPRRGGYESAPTGSASGFLAFSAGGVGLS